MNAKIIVKAMNFHSLLRVDKSRREAEKYAAMEREVSSMMDMILNNRNFVLDKRIFKPEKKKPALNIYIGSDYGFCGALNAQTNAQIQLDGTDCEKLIIGKKLTRRQDVLLRVTQEDFWAKYYEVDEILTRAVKELCYSRINLIYNHYANLTDIKLTRKRIFPLNVIEDGVTCKEKPPVTKGKADSAYTADFTVEGDINELLQDLTIAYLNYEVKIAAVNAYASENIMRQNATNESLRRIEDEEAEQFVAQRKEKMNQAFAKVIESFIKMKSFGGVQ